MTVIRAPSDSDEEDVQTEDVGGVAKAVGKSMKYIRSALGIKTRRRRRKRIRPPPGTKISKNPFFNFLRHLQVELRGMSASEVAQEGGRRWRLMSDWDKEPYRRMALRAQGRSTRRYRAARTRSRASRSRSRSRSRSKSRSRSRGRRKRRRKGVC